MIFLRELLDHYDPMIYDGNDRQMNALGLLKIYF